MPGVVGKKKTMQINDLVNGLFESGGAFLTWINVYKICKDKETKGVFYPVWIFMSLWGLWNLYYYPSVGHYISFYAGIVLVLGNIFWVILAFIYNRRR